MQKAIAKTMNNIDNTAFEARLLAAAIREGYDGIARFEVPARIRIAKANDVRSVGSAIFRVAESRPKTLFYSDDTEVVKYMDKDHCIEKNMCDARDYMVIVDARTRRDVRFLAKESVMKRPFSLANKEECCACLGPVADNHVGNTYWKIDCFHCTQCTASMHFECLKEYIIVGLEQLAAGTLVEFGFKTTQTEEGRACVDIRFPCPVCRLPQIHPFFSQSDFSNKFLKVFPKKQN